MTRRAYIEQIRRLIYGAQPNDEANITIGLVNQWLNQAIGMAARKNYTDSAALDGIAYVNNSFYSTFKGLEAVKDENSLWKVELPHIPIALGTSEGVSTVVFKETGGQVSYPLVWLSMNQLSIQRGMKEIPNKVLGYSEGKYIYAITTIQLSNYTASVTMVSGGISTNLDSELNVPDDYLPIITDYLKNQLIFQRNVPIDATNDGLDAIQTT